MNVSRVPLAPSGPATNSSGAQGAKNFEDAVPLDEDQFLF